MIKVKDIPNAQQFWVFCDIDGQGEKWRLAIARDQSDGEAGIYFPHDDFDDYCNYQDCDAVEIRAPKISGQRGGDE